LHRVRLCHCFLYQQAKRTPTSCPSGLQGEDNLSRQVCTATCLSLSFPSPLIIPAHVHVCMLERFAASCSTILGIWKGVSISMCCKIGVRGDGVGTVPSKIFPLKTEELIQRFHRETNVVNMRWLVLDEAFNSCHAT
jgi:hypothetical protein